MKLIVQLYKDMYHFIAAMQAQLTICELKAVMVLGNKWLFHLPSSVALYRQTIFSFAPFILIIIISNLNFKKTSVVFIA